jgi:hypothetical protein
MAEEKRTPRQDTGNDPHPTHPRNRDDPVQSHRQRRIDEPAAAAQVTDAESGDPAASAPETHGTDPVPRGEPAKTYGVTTGGTTRETAGETPRDVRAGPGDAGGAHAPGTTPDPVTPPRTRSGPAFMWVGFGLAALIVVLVVWAM